MDYKKKYKEEVVRATQLWECGDITRENLEYIFPELKESEDDRKSNGGIVFEDFNEGDGFYKVNLAYLSKEQVEEIENIVKKWNPELKESEDEKIRKKLLALIEWSKSYAASGITVDEAKEMRAWLEKLSTPQVRTGLEWVNTIDDACDKRYAEEYAQGEYCHEQSFKWGFQEGVDWLEEQGEQKPADKVEPKFHEGDWVVYECGEETATLQITRIVGETYVFSDDSTLGVVDEDALRLWDITKDAKDGDVLASELCDSIILFKGIEDNNIQFYCDYDFSEIDVSGDRFAINNGQHYGSVEDSKDFHPATKEQRDTLMKAMADAGYTFDFKKKELKKIVQTPVEWHREDEQNLNACLGYIPDEFLRRWLMDAIHTKYDKPAEWSEEDEKVYNKQ